MTLHDITPRTGRGRLLAAAALLAILAAGAAALLQPLTAFAHHNEYTVNATCAGWTAHAGYVGGTGKRLVVIEQVVVGGQQYDPSWSSGYATGSGTSGGIQQYTGGPIDGKGFVSGEQPATANTYYWFGIDNAVDPNRPQGTSYDWTIFNRSGSWPAGSFSGKIYMYQLTGSGQNEKWDRIETDEVTPPAQPTNCKFKVCKLVESNNDGQTDGGTFSFTITIGSGQPQTFQLTDQEGGGSACKEFAVPAGATATVTEKTDRPDDWLGDQNGYPKYEVENQGEQSGSQATLQFSGSDSTIQVDFRNKEVKGRQLEVCKKVEDDKKAPSKEEWTFTFTLSWDDESTTVTVQDVEEGKSDCVVVEVPDDADVTVTESGRPSGWAGDAPGYPQWEVKSGSSGTGDTATVPANRDKVTFTNKEVPDGNIQVHKYLPKENPSPNAPWQNQGNSPSSQWTFTVYGSLSDAQNGTNAITSFPQLGNNSPPVPQTDLWIKETGLPSDQQFFGWYVPDGGNAHCENQPLDGSTLVTDSILHIPATYWTEKGQNGVLHICVYNKLKTRTVKIIKVISTDEDEVEVPAGNYTFGGQVGSDPWSITINLPDSAQTASASTTLTVPATQLTVTEGDPGPNWWLAGFAVFQGLQQSCANATYQGTSATVPASTSDYTVCIKNELRTFDLEVWKFKGRPDGDDDEEGDEPQPLSGWSITVTGPSGPTTSTTDATGLASFPGLVPGTYTVCETLQNGWSNTGVTVDEQSATPTTSGDQVCVTVTLPGEDGDVVVAFYNERDTGTLRICKLLEENGDAVGREDAYFSFSVDGGRYSATFAVDEGQQAACDEFHDVPTGTHTVTETSDRPDDWAGDAQGYPKVGLGETCTESLGANGFQALVEKDETTTVVFCNQEQPHTGTIVVKKVVTNVDGDTTAFTVTVTPQGGGSSQTATIQESDADGTSFTVVAGQYTVSETPAAGYNLLGWAYADKDGTCPAPEEPAQGSAQVDVQPGATVVLCFYNEKHGTVTVAKRNDVEGQTQPGGSFTWTVTVTVSGGPLGQDVLVRDLLPSGLSYGSITAAAAFQNCDLTPPGISCTLPAGTPAGTYTIVIPVDVPQDFEVCGKHENVVTYVIAPGTDEALDNSLSDTVAVNCVGSSGTIIVKKVVTNDPADTTSFTVTVGGVGVQSVTQTSPAHFLGLDEGTYTVSESDPSGYNLLGHAVLQGEGACPDKAASTDPTATVNVSPLQPTWTVCFYNEKHGTVTVAKRNDVEGQTQPGGSFTWTVTVTVSGGPLGQDVLVRDLLPSGLSYGSITAAAAFQNCDLTPPGISCTLPAGTPAGTYTIVIPVRVPQNFEVCGKHRNVVTYVIAPGTDEALDASLSDTVAVNCVAGSGTIIVKKVVTNDPADTTSFTVTVGGVGVQSVTQTSPAHFLGLDEGTYTVSESDPSGYNLLGHAVLQGEGACPDKAASTDPTATVNVSPLQPTWTVCFYNEKHGTVTVAKRNDVGGQTQPGGSFTWTVTVTVSGGPLGQDVLVTDSLPSGLSYGSITAAAAFQNCDLTPPGISCTLPAGTGAGTYKIVIPVDVPDQSFQVCGPHTNTVSWSLGQGPTAAAANTVTVNCVASSGTIIVKKVVTNDPADPTSFTVTVGGVGSGSFSQDSDAVFAGLAAGSYTVTEAPAAHYVLLGSAVLAGNADCPTNPTGGSTATATVSTGQPEATVCFYNLKLPEPRGTIYIKKVVLDESGNPVPTDTTIFTADVSGVLFDAGFTQTSPAAAANLALDQTYTVHEDPQPNYVFLGHTVVPGANATCPVQGVSLAAGDAAVTLTEAQPEVTVCFYNRLEVRTPTPPTPTPTPTRAAESPTPTPTETVAGEATPGPTATPRAPSAGTGAAGPAGGSLGVLGLLGLALAAAGAGLAVLGRRRT